MCVCVCVCVRARARAWIRYLAGGRPNSTTVEHELERHIKGLERELHPVVKHLVHRRPRLRVPAHLLRRHTRRSACRHVFDGLLLRLGSGLHPGVLRSE